IVPNKNLNISYINNIYEILLKLGFNFNQSDLNTLTQRHDYYPSGFYNNDFILFHFDEKWIHSNYILEYTNIEPTRDDLITFINLLLLNSNKEIIITTGVDCPAVLDNIVDNNFSNRVKIYKDLDFLHLESLISKCKLVISCHGSVSHIAAAHNIKQIDIIEENKLNFYSKWTNHFRNYFPLYREKFSNLSKKIIELL
ncbi:hypothetical protein OAD13_05135, partial [Candidatus Pelagibacter sp.]|nr:hypothetical protein [Candidatus Pelagibacter sp.]